MHRSLESTDVYGKNRSIEFYIYSHQMQNNFYCYLFESKHLGAVCEQRV